MTGISKQQSDAMQLQPAADNIWVSSLSFQFDSRENITLANECTHLFVRLFCATNSHMLGEMAEERRFLVLWAVFMPSPLVIPSLFVSVYHLSVRPKARGYVNTRTQRQVHFKCIRSIDQTFLWLSNWLGYSSNINAYWLFTTSSRIVTIMTPATDNRNKHGDIK